MFSLWSTRRTIIPVTNPFSTTKKLSKSLLFVWMHVIKVLWLMFNRRIEFIPNTFGRAQYQLRCSSFSWITPPIKNHFSIFRCNAYIAYFIHQLFASFQNVGSRRPNSACIRSETLRSYRSAPVQSTTCLLTSHCTHNLSRWYEQRKEEERKIANRSQRDVFLTRPANKERIPTKRTLIHDSLKVNFNIKFINIWMNVSACVSCCDDQRSVFVLMFVRSNGGHVNAIVCAASIHSRHITWRVLIYLHFPCFVWFQEQNSFRYICTFNTRVHFTLLRRMTHNQRMATEKDYYSILTV